MENDDQHHIAQDGVDPSVAASAVVPHEQGTLPMRRNEETGLETVDWDALLVLPSDDRLVVEYLKVDLDPELIKTTGRQLLEMYDRGLMPSMRDVFEITRLAVERNPKLSMVADQMTRNGYSAERVGLLWDTRDTLGVSVDQTHTIFDSLSFDISDEKDVEMVDAVLEAIEIDREVPRHTAAVIMIEGLKAGLSLSEIAKGAV